MLQRKYKHFLRYKSDRNIYGWLISSFILLFQHYEMDNVIYGIDINLDENWGDGKHSFKCKKGDDVAVVCLAKYVYNNTELLKDYIEKISPADHWKFSDPLYRLNNKMDESDKPIPTDWGYFIHRIAQNDETFKKYYMSLNRIVCTTIPLHEITADNLKDKIFGTFDNLADL